MLPVLLINLEQIFRVVYLSAFVNIETFHAPLLTRRQACHWNYLWSAKCAFVNFRSLDGPNAAFVLLLTEQFVGRKLDSRHLGLLFDTFRSLTNLRRKIPFQSGNWFKLALRTTDQLLLHQTIFALNLRCQFFFSLHISDCQWNLENAALQLHW